MHLIVYQACIMKVRNTLTYILFIFLFLAARSANAQVPSESPVVPIPLVDTHEKHDSLDAEVLKAKYDSLVAYMNRVYLNETMASAVKEPAMPVVKDTAVSPATAIPADTVIVSGLKQVKDSTPDSSIPPPAFDPVILAPVKPVISDLHYIAAQDTPRIRLPKDSIKGDTMLLDEIGTEEQLVDTNAVENQSDISDGDDADEEGDAEGEFDNSFTGYSDITYWDMLRDPNFKFDEAMIPANTHYPYDWDTVVINPYKVSLKDMNDTILLKLKDSMDCAFHPPAIGDITSTFGFRKWARKPKFHYGVDVRMEVGDPVYAIFDGVVRVAKRSSDYGYVVLIRHYNGLETLYAHFDQLLAYPGKPVRSGEIIGLSGNTGRSTGPHLHFEVRFKGEKVDPNKIINFPSGSLLSDTLQIDKTCFSHLYKVQQTKLRSRYYVVKRGDTLGKIAYKNGVTVKQIARLNRISAKTKLKAGRKLRLR